jgi:hypothetical protein
MTKLESWKKSKKLSEFYIQKGLDGSGFGVEHWSNMAMYCRLLAEESEKVYVIDDDIRDFLLHTKNEVFARPPPFPVMFLDADLKIGTFEIWGILLVCGNLDTFREEEEKFKKSVIDNHEIYEQELKKYLEFAKENNIDNVGSKEFIQKYMESNSKDIVDKKIKVINDILRGEDFSKILKDGSIDAIKGIQNGKFNMQVFSIGYDSSDETIFISNDNLKSEEITYDSNFSMRSVDNFGNEIITEYGHYDSVGFDQSKMNKLRDGISVFVCNFLDMLNNPDVEVGLISKDNQQKRINRGKTPLPSHYVVKLLGELKKYAEQNKKDQERFGYSHKFWVQGHMRRFRSQQKYIKLYTSYAEGDKKYHMLNGVLATYVPPYIKGDGLLIEKKYLVK